MIDKKFINDNVIVIIRSVGERTEKFCYDLAKEQINEKNIKILNYTPFTKALEKNFKYAIERNKKWTLIIDADVLILKDTIQQLINFGEENLTDKLYVIHGYMIDKFIELTKNKNLNNGRLVGIHLYQTKNLKNAISLIPKEFDEIRPEGYTTKKMIERGFLLLFYEKNILGYHDFEQYYEDIYRKGFVHSYKHRKILNMEQIIKKSKNDNDFKILLRGINDGNKYENKISINKNSDFIKNFSSMLNDFNIEEKKILNINNLNDIYKDNIKNE